MPVPPFSNSAPRKGGVASKQVAASFTPSRAGSIRSMRELSGGRRATTNARRRARCEWHSCRAALRQQPAPERANRGQTALARTADQPDLAARLHARPDAHQRARPDLAVDHWIERERDSEPMRGGAQRRAHAVDLHALAALET